MNVILAIHPKWANLIYEGKKTIEWRKSFPKAQKIDKVFLYETAPVKQITGFFTLGEIGCYLVSSVCAQSWDIIERGCVPMTDLIKYRENVDCIFGWIIDKAKKFTKPQNIDDFGLKRPPQSWCYTDYEITAFGQGRTAK